MTEPNTDLAPYDAVILGSFGGPESMDEVMPFLRRVTAGRGVPDERLAEVAEHYVARDGVSPINALNRDLLARLQDDLATRGIDVPVIWGNRNSEPYFHEAFSQALERGASRVVVVLTSAYSAYSSCRQYRENLADAVEGLGAAADGLVVDKVRPYFDDPVVGAIWADRLTEAAARVTDPEHSRILFVTHSIPVAMDETSGPGDGDGDLYSDQHGRLGAALLDQVNSRLGAAFDGELVYCSRSGPPQVPWLEPDIGDRITELAAEGVTSVVVAPIGFISDHMEVIHDLDTEAAEIAAEQGVEFIRVATPGDERRFAGAIVGLLLDRAAEARGEVVVEEAWLPGDRRPSVCAPGCCPNLRADRPALCGSSW